MPSNAIRCGECRKPITPTKAQSALIQKGRVSGMRMVMIECPNCGLATDVILREEALLKPSGNPEHDLIYRCPTSACDGNVVYVDHLRDQPFWGCGECGR